MKRKLPRLLLGLACSILVAMGTQFRLEAIRNSPPLAINSADRGRYSKRDLSQDLQRIRDEAYQPIRPVSEDGSALQIVERTAYAAPGALFSALLSPLFLPVLADAGMFREAQRYRVPLGASLPRSMESSAVLEGAGWGLAQSIVFYLTFFLTRKRSAKNEPSVAGTPAQPGV